MWRGNLPTLSFNQLHLPCYCLLLPQELLLLLVGHKRVAPLVSALSQGHPPLNKAPAVAAEPATAAAAGDKVDVSSTEALAGCVAFI